MHKFFVKISTTGDFRFISKYNQIRGWVGSYYGGGLLCMYAKMGCEYTRKRVQTGGKVAYGVLMGDRCDRGTQPVWSEH